MSQTHVLLSQFPGPLMPNTPKDKVSPSVTALWCLLMYAFPMAVLIPILQQNADAMCSMRKYAGAALPAPCTQAGCTNLF